MIPSIMDDREMTIAHVLVLIRGADARHIESVGSGPVSIALIRWTAGEPDPFDGGGLDRAELWS